MALEPITRQEKIIAGQDLTPITRMEKFLKNFGGSGGGGGVQMVTITAVSDSSGKFTYTSSHTGSEINEMAQKGIVMAKVLDMNDVMQALCTYNGSYGNGATFAFGSAFNSRGVLNLISVMPDTTAAEMATIT